MGVGTAALRKIRISYTTGYSWFYPRSFTPCEMSGFSRYSVRQSASWLVGPTIRWAATLGARVPTPSLLLLTDSALVLTRSYTIRTEPCRSVRFRPVRQLGSVEDYKILSQSDCTTLEDVDDADQFQGVKAAFDTIGMEEETQMQVRWCRRDEGRRDDVKTRRDETRRDGTQRETRMFRGMVVRVESRGVSIRSARSGDPVRPSFFFVNIAPDGTRVRPRRVLRRLLPPLFVCSPPR